MVSMSEPSYGYPHTYGVQSLYDDYNRIDYRPRRRRASSSSSEGSQAYGDTYGFPHHGDLDKSLFEIDDDTPSTPSSGRYEPSDSSGGREEPSIGVRLNEAAAGLTLERLELEHELFLDGSHSGNSVARHNAEYNALRDHLAAENSQSEGRSSEEEYLPFDEEDPSSWERDRSLEDYRPGLVVRYHQFQEPPMPAPRRRRPSIPPGTVMPPAEASVLEAESRSSAGSMSEWVDRKSDSCDSSGGGSDSGSGFRSQA